MLDIGGDVDERLELGVPKVQVLRRNRVFLGVAHPKIGLNMRKRREQRFFLGLLCLLLLISLSFENGREQGETEGTEILSRFALFAPVDFALIRRCR